MKEEARDFVIFQHLVAAQENDTGEVIKEKAAQKTNEWGGGYSKQPQKETTWGKSCFVCTDQRQHKLKVQLGSNGIKKKRAEDFRLKEFGGGKENAYK